MTDGTMPMTAAPTTQEKLHKGARPATANRRPPGLRPHGAARGPRRVLPRRFVRLEPLWYRNQRDGS